MERVRIAIEYVHTSKLRQWKGNPPRVICDQQYHSLAEGVRWYGLVDPLIVDVAIKRWEGRDSGKTAIRVGPGSAVGGSP